MNMIDGLPLTSVQASAEHKVEDVESTFDQVDDSINLKDSVPIHEICDDLVMATQGLLYAAGEILTIQDLCLYTGLETADQQRVMDYLIEKLAQDPQSAIEVRAVEKGYMLVTKSAVKPWLEPLFAPKKQSALTPAAYEALAVVAYNQPVTRAQIEAVRGVQSDQVVNRLQERGLIEITGHLNAPGRPALFETTQKFLLETGLSSLDELEPMEMMMYDTLQDMENRVAEQMSEAKDGNRH